MPNDIIKWMSGGTTNYNEFNEKVYSEVPISSTILDVGCDTGKLGEMLRKTKNPKYLAGIELNRFAAKSAKKYYDRIITTDIEMLGKLPFTAQFFDCVVMADILEHLKNPEKFVKFVTKYLSKNGYMIVSVPNVLFVLNRFALMLGKFDYRSKGIMDASHLRFFTMSSIVKLLTNCGLKVIKTRGYINTRPSLRFLDYFARIFPGLFAYQFLIVATKS